MSRKIFRNLDEQVDILRKKGLQVPDVEKAKNILLRENYFFISGYRHIFLRASKDKKFLTGTTFDELHGTFIFDRHLRNIMFKNILMIENNIKSIISYTLSQKYGFKDKEYLEPKNFTSDPLRVRQVVDVISKMKRQIRLNGRQHQATSHYLDNYGYIPLWILVKVLSFGLVAELYTILKLEDKETISAFYKMDSETLGIYLSILANFRNLCAHEDILYTHKTQRSIPDTKYHELLQIDRTDGEYNFGKNDLFAVFIILKHMLRDIEFRTFIYEVGYEIDMLNGKVNVVPINHILNKMGVPDNWRVIIEL